MVAAHIAFGQRGEELAAQWYVQHGYTDRGPQLAMQAR